MLGVISSMEPGKAGQRAVVCLPLQVKMIPLLLEQSHHATIAMHARHVRSKVTQQHASRRRAPSGQPLHCLLPAQRALHNHAHSCQNPAVLPMAGHCLEHPPSLLTCQIARGLCC